MNSKLLEFFLYKNYSISLSQNSNSFSLQYDDQAKRNFLQRHPAQIILIPNCSIKPSETVYFFMSDIFGVFLYPQDFFWVIYYTQTKLVFGKMLKSEV